MQPLIDTRTEDEQLADAVAEFFADPLGFVMFAYDWDNDPELHIVKLPAPWSLVYNSVWGPDAWACKFLDDLGAKIRANQFDGTAPVDAIREGVVSGHGVGKSALAAWLVDFIMSTRPLSIGTITANTNDQLRSKTWAQIAKWTKKCITGHWFDVTTGGGAMRMSHKQHPEKWFCTAQTCRAENSEAFAGQHAPSATSFYIFDEAAGIENIIDEVSEGGLTDGEPMKFAFGNGTRNSGWFKDCFGAKRHRWGNTHVDSRTVQITNKKFIEETIADHGIDSDWVKVRVRGMFPAQSVLQFISGKDIDAAFGRQLRDEQFNFAPKILVLDNAWEGDDEGVISMRQGLKFEVLRTFAKNDNDIEVANMLSQLEDTHKADAVFIDAGYGTGVVSCGTTLGRSWTLVWFASESSDPGYFNKRAQMFGGARDWLKAGGAIPPDQVLQRELNSLQTVPRLDGKIQLESKKDMKKRGEASPGRADTLALTFAYPVVAKALQHMVAGGAPSAAQREYDPYASLV